MNTYSEWLNNLHFVFTASSHWLANFVHYTRWISACFSQDWQCLSSMRYLSISGFTLVCTAAAAMGQSVPNLEQHEHSGSSNGYPIIEFIPSNLLRGPSLFLIYAAIPIFLSLSSGSWQMVISESLNPHFLVFPYFMRFFELYHIAL